MQADGFITGRPTALFVLDYGSFQVKSNGRKIGICGFLIQTDADEAILVDTGFPEKYTRVAEVASREDGLSEFGQVLECGPQNSATAQLALLGIAAADITLHVCTHTHIDHMGGLADFPNAPILIHQAERALTRPLYWGAIQPMTWPDRRYLQIAQDTLVGPGLTVLSVPGHTAGQLALLIDLPSGPILLTGDAISRPAEIDEGFEGARDPVMARNSALRLMALAADREAFVIYGHCPKQWRTLKKAPEGYI